jgi:hypothetical protein
MISSQKDLKITQQVKLEIKLAEEKLKKQENKLGQALSRGSIPKDKFEMTFKRLRTSWIEHREESAIRVYETSIKERTQHYWNLSASIKMERVMIGSGTAATMVFDKLDPQARQQVLVLNDMAYPSTWFKGGNERLMTQPERLQAPGFLESSSFIKDEENEYIANPYQYSRMRHVFLAQLEKQNELNMPIVNLKAKTIQSLKNISEREALSWEDKNYPYRIPVFISEDKDQVSVKYIYTQYIDICIGTGKERRLSPEQISPELEAKCVQNKKLIYEVQDASYLRDGVIFYGGSAGNGTMIAEIEERRKEKKFDRHQPFIAGWYTRSKGDFDDNKMLITLNRLVQSTILAEREKKEASKLHDGYALKKVQETSDGHLEVVFEEQDSKKQKNVSCAQLVVSIAQDPLDLTKDLQSTDFTPVIHHGIPLGLTSDDRRVVVWGAAAATFAGLLVYLKKDSRKIEEIARLTTAHAMTLPHESKVAPGIFSVYKKTEQLAKLLSQSDHFSLRKETVREKFFRQINAATKNELIEIFQSDSKISKHYKKDHLEIFADKIIALRSKMMPIQSFDVGGIHRPSQLLVLKKEIPLELLNVLRVYYFPHSSAFKFFSSKNDGLFNKRIDPVRNLQSEKQYDFSFPSSPKS